MVFGVNMPNPDCDKPFLRWRKEMNIKELKRKFYSENPKEFKYWTCMGDDQPLASCVIDLGKKEDCDICDKYEKKEDCPFWQEIEEKNEYDAEDVWDWLENELNNDKD